MKSLAAVSLFALCSSCSAVHSQRCDAYALGDARAECCVINLDGTRDCDSATGGRLSSVAGDLFTAIITTIGAMWTAGFAP